jgi:2'-5' RNA ligase
LVFLGNVEAQRVPALTRMAADVQGSTIDLALDAVGYWRHNRIVWIGAQVSPETLRELVRQLVAGVRDLGLPTESREYVPHITLLRKAQRGPAGNDMTAIEWHATEFMLMRSIPHEGSVAYEVIGHWPLARRA